MVIETPASPAWDELRAYSRRLRDYSTEELEDIYFHIHILKEPLHYKLLVRELEARRVSLTGPAPRREPPDLRAWATQAPLLARWRPLRAAALALLFFAVSCAVTFGLLAPIWLFAMPLRFLGLETAIIYFACAPIAPILGAGIGGRLGGRGAYGLFVLLGVAAGMLLFHATGAPDAIIESLRKPMGGSAWSM
jgi:hypothetical protein